MWSILVNIFLPIRYCHHFVRACIMESIYLSYVDFILSLLLIFRISNVIERPSCIKTAPISNSEASRSTIKGFVKPGIVNTDVDDIMFFNASKHFSASSFHRNEFFFNKSVRGVVLGQSYGLNSSQISDSILSNLEILLISRCYRVWATQ